MSVTLRFALVVSAFIVLLFIVRELRKSSFNSSDSLFWLLFSGCLVLVAAIPEIAFFFSDFLGFQSPSNFIFVVVIAFLLVREFTIQSQLSKLREKVAVLAQEIALESKHSKFD